MKYLSATIILLAWMIASLLLCFSVIGIILASDESWTDIPKKILSVYDE